MGKNTNTFDKDPLTGMLNAATKDDLIGLIRKLIKNDLSGRRTCIDYLKPKITVNSSIQHSAESSAALSLWYEIEPELSELDEYGGGDYKIEKNVGEGLYQLDKKLQEITLSEEDRDELLNEVLLYIKSGNSGMDDSLYDITYVICKNDDQLRDLAERFEDLKQDWPIDNARRIYKKIGDHKKYLELRSKKMRYGLDYYDLVSFYWDLGEHEKAIDTAQKGMEKAEGRMDELRMFLAERAKETGNRETYLDYYFDLKTHSLTLSSYREFEQACQQEEWERYEPRLVEMLKKNFNIQAVKIYMHRQDYETALQYFKKPTQISYYVSYEELSVAEELELRYPEQILEFYKSSIGSLNVSASRKIYSQNAVAVARVRRVLVDVMKKPDKWKKLALAIKLNNTKRPAFQDEFARIIPDWDSL